ncbi:MAG: YybH family protein [Flectobacillus sp.]|mgnify:CR=1 FL=1|uniref:YybH family protein n=1 Tax=Flectobacillus sp. TaxID=50419 RepID=UPI003B99A4CB
MIKHFIFSALFCLTCLSGLAQTNKDKQQILETLDKQNQAWNRGDVVSFMKGYWESDSLMYIGKNGVTYGYQKTLASYQKNYPDKASMGTLKFTIIKVNFLGPQHCLLVGKWELSRPEKGDIGGHFTLTWQKIKGEWVIIADHSS